MDELTTQTQGDNMSPTKRALLAVKELKGKLAALEEAKTEPIAIIGMGCRFPGNAHDPEAFWQLLQNGTDAITEVPTDRWDVNKYFDTDINMPGKMSTRWGGFLDHIDQFDASFFGIAPREAAHMDPQQRLLLEVSWSAMEDAGQAVDRLAGSSTGVFVGISHSDYALLQMNELDAYSSSGNAHSIAANRLSYLFDFRGPSIAVDTACSSSLVAVHLACRSLRHQDCNMALAGGVNLMVSPLPTISFSKAHMMAADGRCKTFDARADGFVRGEGCGVVVLKRLSDALADHDPILALICGSAINQDGRTTGLTAPNGLAQQAVIRQALASAKVDPHQISYIEAHGTGTALGDPIEVEALAAVLGQAHPHTSPCVIGSVKTNIGHLESAAGIAGLIKVVLALQHETIPSHLHFQELNPHMSADLPFVIPRESLLWAAGAKKRYAGVSSFGFGGTNAHIVVAEAPEINKSSQMPEAPTGAHTYLLPLSAHSPQALQDLAADYQDFLETSVTNNAPAVADLCYTAGVRRNHHAYRLALVGRTAQAFHQQLTTFRNGDVDWGVARGQRLPGAPPSVVFVFCGQGSQWAGMGQELMATEPVFRETVERCDQLLHQYTDWSLLTELAADEATSRLAETEIAQPAIFATQVGLAQLWQSWGVQPRAVVGHSVGEIAAAYVAGVLSLKDAIRIVYHRARLMQRATGQGKMGLVELPMAQVMPVLNNYRDRLSIAAINSPTETVLSGESLALAELMHTFTEQSVFCRLLPVNYAFHSPQMASSQSELTQTLAGLKPKTTTIPIYATVTGRIEEGSSFDAVYWGRNLREPVQFADAIDAAAADEHQIFLEIGPHPVLAKALAQNLHTHGRIGTVLASLRRQRREKDELLNSLGALYANGISINWKRLYDEPRSPVKLPAYPLQRERYWTQKVWQDVARFGAQTVNGHPLLIQNLMLATRPESQAWEVQISHQQFSYLGDHRLQGAVVIPATFYMEMMLAGAQAHAQTSQPILTNILFHKALFLPEDGTRIVQAVLSIAADNTMTCQIYSRTADQNEWSLHATGTICQREDDHLVPETVIPAQIRARCPQEISISLHFQGFRERGIQYGPCFQALAQLWQGDGEALGKLHIPSDLDADWRLYHLHPALLDAAIQTLGAAIPAVIADKMADPYVPVSLEELCVYDTFAPQVWSYARLRTIPDDTVDTLIGDIELQDESGQVIASIRGLHLQRLGATVSYARLAENWLYELHWQSQELVTSKQIDNTPGLWFIFTGKEGMSTQLQTQLTARGETCVLVTPGSTYQAVDATHYQINPDHSQEFEQLFADIARAYPTKNNRGVLYFGQWVDRSAPIPETEVAHCVTVLYLVQALIQTKQAPLPQLWLITTNTQIQPTSMAQSTLWGLGRSIMHEHPELNCRLIDVDSGATMVAQLFHEIWLPGPENQIALRGQTRYVARLIHVPTMTGVPRPRDAFRDDAAYLITGGLGGIGLAVCQWMVSQGARHIVLLGRRAATAAAQKKINHMIQHGANILIVQADVTIAMQLVDVLKQIEQQMPPLRGIIHAAGVIEDGILLHLQQEQFASVMMSKVAGAWNLHTLTADIPLDFLVLFSSAASVLGSPGQANYAAANVFLDNLAQYRRYHNLPAMSINWGPWSEVGMLARVTQDDQTALRHLNSLSVSQGVTILGTLLAHNPTQIAVLPFDWQQWLRVGASFAGSPLLSEIVTKIGMQAQTDRRRPAQEPIRHQLLAAATNEQLYLLTKYLVTLVAGVVKLPEAKVDIQRPLTELGLDSLMAIELKNEVEMDLAIIVPVVDILQGPSITQLSSTLLDLVLAIDASASGFEQQSVNEEDEWEVLKI